MDDRPDHVRLSGGVVDDVGAVDAGRGRDGRDSAATAAVPGSASDRRAGAVDPERFGGGRIADRTLRVHDAAEYGRRSARRQDGRKALSSSVRRRSRRAEGIRRRRVRGRSRGAGAPRR